MKKHWITCLVLFVGLFSYQTSEGQVKARMFWQATEEFDEDAVLHVGINFHYTHSTYFLRKNTGWDAPQMIDGQNDSFTAITSRAGSGVGMGISAAYSLSKRVQLMLNPLVKMSSSNTSNILPGRGVNFTTTSGQEILKMNHLSGNNPTSGGTENSVGGNFYNLDVPLVLKVKSDAKIMSRENPYNTYRMYLVGGGRWTHLLNAAKYYSLSKNPISPYEVTNPTLIFKPNYFSWESGVGIELMFRYFKLTPELSFVQSIGSVLDHKKHQEVQTHFNDNALSHPNSYMESIKFMGIRGWQLKLIFE